MANICRTEVIVNASPEALKDFIKKYDACSDDDLISEFGIEGENNIERIGCKWIQKYDAYEEEDTQFFFSVETAWYPPDKMLENIYKLLVSQDENAYITGRYWDENYKPIGIFQVVKGEFEYSETGLEVDTEQEWYWDNIVEPAFDNLEL